MFKNIILYVPVCILLGLFPLFAEDPADANLDPAGTENLTDPESNPDASVPTNPAEFRQYQTNREKRNRSFDNLYNQEADRRFRFILEQISEGQNDSAKRRLEEFLILYPNHPMAGRARRELAALQEKNGDYRASLYRYQQSAILERPDQAEPHSLLEMARIQIKQGQYSRARQILQDIQNRYPGTKEAREARLLERSYRFIEAPERPTTGKTDSGADQNPDSGKPLFPMENGTETGEQTDPGDTGIDTAEGSPSTGQTALDRMGEGIEKPESGTSMDSAEPLDGEPKKTP
ncbi:MAG: hypothetical protein CMF59_14550 [Leptospiraceae bacterium]|nr:hypothetical protein [Leptospiraceae bacterium]